MKLKSVRIRRFFVITPMLVAVLATAGPVVTDTGNDLAAAYEEVASTLKNPDTSGEQKKKSFDRMRELAGAGHLPAIAGLGYLYQEGLGTPANPSHAAEWLRKAADKGHAVSMFNLAHLLVTDKVPLAAGEKDRAVHYAEGIDWYRRAAEAGLERARLAYGIILMRGDYDSKPNPQLAATYLIPAAEAGNLEAMNALGNMYEVGSGVAHSPASAEMWLRKAAENGHIKARSNLSRVLDPHSTDDKRRIEAIAWLVLAEEDRDVVGTKLLAVKAPSFSPQDMAAARKQAAEIRRRLRKTERTSESVLPGDGKP